MTQIAAANIPPKGASHVLRTAYYVLFMKRVLPILVAAIAAAIAIVKLREETPLPQQPEGSWELADDKPS